MTSLHIRWTQAMPAAVRVHEPMLARSRDATRPLGRECPRWSHSIPNASRIRGGRSSGRRHPARGGRTSSQRIGRMGTRGLRTMACGQCWHPAHTERNLRRENAALGRHAGLRQSHPLLPACFQVTHPEILPLPGISSFTAFMFPASIIAVFGCNRRARHPCRLVADWGAYPAALPRETRFMEGHGWRFRTGYRQAVASPPHLPSGKSPTSGAKPKPAGGTA